MKHEKSALLGLPWPLCPNRGKVAPPLLQATRYFAFIPANDLKPDIPHHSRVIESFLGVDTISSVKEETIPTATLVEHTLLTQGFMGTSTVSFPHHWRPQHHDSTWPNLVDTLK